MSQNAGAVCELPDKRDQHVLADVERGQADLLQPRAVHLQVERRIVQALVHVGIDRAGDLLDRFGQLGGERRVPARLAPVNWTSIAAGRPKFRIWVTMSAGWKKNSMPGKPLGQFGAQRA